MKNLIKPSYLCLTMALFIVITGCSSSDTPRDNSYHVDTDYPYMFYQQGLGSPIAPSDQGYYFLDQNLINYADKATMKPVLLDNRPNHGCLQEPTTQNCYAYVQSNSSRRANFLQFYDSKLYVLESYWDKEHEEMFHISWILSRMDADGKNRKTVKNFDTEPNSLAIHRGYLYYSVTDSDKYGVLRSSVHKIPINDLKQTGEEIYLSTGKKERIGDLLPYGNQLYWIYIDDQGYNTIRYDFTTGQINGLWAQEETSFSRILSISDNKLFFSYFYGDPSDTRVFSKYSSDLKGDNIQSVKLEFPPVMSYFYQDSRYSYVLPIYEYIRDRTDIPHKMAIYSKEQISPKIIEIDMNGAITPYDMVIGDDRYMFMIYGLPKDDSEILYLDKDLISTGSAKFQTLLETKQK